MYVIFGFYKIVNRRKVTFSCLKTTSVQHVSVCGEVRINNPLVKVKRLTLQSVINFVFC